MAGFLAAVGRFLIRRKVIPKRTIVILDEFASPNDSKNSKGIINMSGKSLGDIDVDFLRESKGFYSRMEALITLFGKELHKRNFHSLAGVVYDFRRLMNGADVTLGVNTRGIRYFGRFSGNAGLMVAALGYVCLQWQKYSHKELPGKQMDYDIKCLEAILPSKGFDLEKVGDLEKGYTFDWGKLVKNEQGE